MQTKETQDAGTAVSNRKALNSPPPEISKAATGISNLDEILHGGFPENRTTLIKGAPGAGKTLLGLEFLYRCAMSGEPALLISFEESADALRRNALAMGWDISALEASKTFFLWDARIDRSMIASGEFTVDAMLATVKGKAEEIGARRIMIDAIDVLMRIFENPGRERHELYRIHESFVEQGFTSVFTAKISENETPGSGYDFFEYMADCVLFLDTRVVHQIATRRLRVTKYRGSGFHSNEYPYLITPEGNVILPITQMHLTYAALSRKISSGHENLDRALGGGFFHASAILISGPTGSGKTTLASVFTEHACSRGEKVLYVSFEESQEGIIAAMRVPGIDLETAVETGGLQFYAILPEALVPEAHLYYLLQRIDLFGPDHIVVDAVSACKRMGTDEAAFDFLIRLINSCKQRNITCLMTRQANRRENIPHDLDGGVSSIIDTLISLQFEETRRRMERHLLIVKSRGAHHSNRRYLYSITDTGVRIDPLDHETGERVDG